MSSPILRNLLVIVALISLKQIQGSNHERGDFRLEVRQCFGQPYLNRAGLHNVFDYHKTLKEICGDLVEVEVSNRQDYDYETTYYDITTQPTIANQTDPYEIKMFWHLMEQNTASGTYDLHYAEATIPSTSSMPSSEAETVPSLFPGSSLQMGHLTTLNITGKQNCDFGEVLLAGRPVGSNDYYTVFDRIRTRPPHTCSNVNQVNVTLNCQKNLMFDKNVIVNQGNNPDEFTATLTKPFTKCQIEPAQGSKSSVKREIDSLPFTVVTFARKNYNLHYGSHKNGTQAGQNGTKERGYCRTKQITLTDVVAVKDKGVYSWTQDITANGKQLDVSTIHFQFNNERPLICGPATIFISYDLFGISQPNNCDDFEEFEVNFTCTSKMHHQSVEVIPDVVSSGHESYILVANQTFNRTNRPRLFHVNHAGSVSPGFTPKHFNYLGKEAQLIKAAQVFVQEVQEPVTNTESTQLLQDILTREDIDATNPCIQALQNFGDDSQDVVQLFDDARKVCDADMDQVLNYLQQFMNQTDEENGKKLFRQIIGHATRNSNLNKRPCPKIDEIEDMDIIGSVDHLSTIAKKLKRMMNVLTEDDNSDECMKLDEISGIQIAYLKLKKLLRNDGRLRLLINSALKESMHRERFRGEDANHLRQMMSYMEVPEREIDNLKFLQHCPRPDTMMPETKKHLFYKVIEGKLKIGRFNPLRSNSTKYVCFKTLAVINCTQCQGMGRDPYSNHANNMYGGMGGGMNYNGGGMNYNGGGMNYNGGGMNYNGGGMNYNGGGMNYNGGGMNYNGGTNYPRGGSGMGGTGVGYTRASPWGNMGGGYTYSGNTRSSVHNGPRNPLNRNGYTATYPRKN